ncbi:MAG: hypothetical protein J5597_02175 [Spirochaetaceae bacterium]|nr:hypothetical protein [Spirochaetaceae bacterium]
MKNNYFSLKSFLTIIFLVFFVLTLFSLLQLDFYAHPSDNDNYAGFIGLKQLSSLYRNPLNPIISRGLSIRYSASLFGLFKKIPSIITDAVMRSLIVRFRIVALIQILCFTISVFYLCYSFNKYIAKQNKIFLFVIFTLSYYILLISSTYIFHTFYEMVSASGYTTGLWLCFLLIGLLIDNYHTDKKYFPIAIVIFFLCGMLELFPIIAGSILLYSFVLKIIKKRKIDYIFILFGIFIITVFILNFFSPGQIAKLELYGKGYWVTDKEESRFSLHQIIIYLKEYVWLGYYSVKTLLRKRNILFTVTLTTTLSVSLIKRNKTINIFTIVPYYFVIAICGFSFHYCYLSINGLQRANNLLSILMSLLNIIFITSLEEFTINYTLPLWKSLYNLIKSLYTKKEIVTFTNEIKNYFDIKRKPIFIINTIFVIFILLFFVIKPGNTIADCYSAILTGSAKRYDQELMARYKTIINSKDSVVYVPKLSNPPQVLFYTDTVENGTWAAFFNKEKILYTNIIEKQ